MCAGEYVATKSQNEVMEGEVKLETEHVLNHLQDELSELASLLNLIGIDSEQAPELHAAMCAFYQEHPASLLKIMVALEFGVIQQEQRSPVCAGLTSCALFTVGALPSVLPFIFSGDRPIMGLIIAAVLTIVALLTVGAVKTWATRGNCFTAAIENLVIAGLGGGLAYGVGVLFDHVLH